jgi:peptidoglycan/LPS O-acetylase OafA/YrhL
LTVLQRYPDMAPTAAYLPGVGEFVGPHLIANGAEVTKNLLWGKSYFHLYFMSVLLQLTLIFPLLFFALRKIQMQFGTVLISALGLQGIVYFVQMSHLQARFPASMVIWYVPSVLLGVWLGLNWHQWEEIWRKYRWGLAAGATGGLALYLYWSIVRMTGGTIPLSMYYSGSFIIYSTSISLVLLALAQKIEGTRAGDFLRLIGNWSIALFLVHPIILYYLSGPTITGVLGRMPFSPLWSGLLMFGTACAFIWLTIRLRADLWLFGRRLGENRTGASWLHVIGPREAPVRALEAKPLAATTTDSVA